MNTDQDQRPPMKDEPQDPEPQRATPEGLFCPKKGVYCDHWTGNRCSKAGRWRADETEKE